MNTAIKTVVVVHASAEWRTFHRRSMLQALAAECPETIGVMVVNRPVTFDVGPWRHPRKFFAGFWRSAVAEERPNLITLTPRLPLHEIVANRLPFAVSVNSMLMRRQVHGAIGRLFPKAEQLIQWIYYPSQRWVWDAFHGNAKVYECYDDYPRAASGVFDNELWMQEQQVLREADLTFATALSLMEERATIARRLKFLPNGVPDFFFDQSPAFVDETIQSVPHPRIGYLGNIFSHMDYPLLEELFQQNPQWHFVLVGPIENQERVAKLRSLRNVHYVGPRPYAQVPSVLRQMDVGLIPFLDNTFTRAINPLKLYEYLAVGLPTVATQLPELDRFKDVIWLPRNTVQDYQAAITAAISSPPQKSKSEMVEAAKPYAWANIARQYVLPPLMDILQR